MFSRITLITVSLFAFLIGSQDLQAQQKAPLDDSFIIEMSNDIDETVVLELNMEPDTPAEPIVIGIEAESKPRLVPQKAVVAPVVAINAEHPLGHLRTLTEKALPEREKQ
jgi:hypothetical protein